jgi:hypothetical protein
MHLLREARELGAAHREPTRVTENFWNWHWAPKRFGASNGPLEPARASAKSRT